MQWQEVNGLFSNLHSLFIISSQNVLMVRILCSTDRKMKLHKDNESIIRSFAKLSTDYSIMPILRQKFTNQTTLFWLDNRKLEEKQYKKSPQFVPSYINSDSDSKLSTSVNLIVMVLMVRVHCVIASIPEVYIKLIVSSNNSLFYSNSVKPYSP